MGQRKEYSYYDRMTDMKDFESVENLREYFMEKAGSLEFFREKNFENYIKAIVDLMAFMEESDPDSMLPKVSIDVLKQYLKWLRNKGNAPGTQRLKVSQIKRWVRSNGVKLDWEDLVIPTVRTMVRDRAPTKTELRRILNYAPTWVIPVVMILVSSGMRVGSLLQLKLKHLDLTQFPDIGIMEVPPDAAKGWVGYFTAITPEARQAVENNLTYRRGLGEKLGPESPLIKSPNAKVQTTYGSMNPAYNRTLKRAGLTEKSRGVHVLHIHTLRKFFRSQLEGVMTKSIREALMGHVTGEYLDGAYLRIPIPKLVLWYRKGVPALTLTEDVLTEEYEMKQFLRNLKVSRPDIYEEIENILAEYSSVNEAWTTIEPVLKRRFEPVERVTRELLRVKSIDEMMKYCAKGWDVFKDIPGGEYILVRN
jgi:integrase